jgi:CheY-like chemotaxis protein
MSARILVVEDSPNNMYLMTYLLRAHTHTVIPAASGEQALGLARASCPDLIVMDLQLPGIDGQQTLTAMRSEPGLCDVPVIAVTSFALVGDRDRILAAGFDHYMAKPIDPATFTHEIDAYLPLDLRSSAPN